MQHIRFFEWTFRKYFMSCISSGYKTVYVKFRCQVRLSPDTE